MSRRKEFTTANGSDGMIIDCDDYTVEIFKSVDQKLYLNTITFTSKIRPMFNTIPLPYCFKIDWDKQIEGGKLTIKFRDQWGSELVFTHYEPSDIKGMFDFIGKGYNVFDKLHAISGCDCREKATAMAIEISKGWYPYNDGMLQHEKTREKISARDMVKRYFDK